QPTIVAVTPPAARAGSTVTLTGLGFHSTSASNIVYFGAVRGDAYAALSSGLKVTVPPGATYAPVSLTTPNGLTAYSSAPFVLTFSSTHVLASGSFGAPVDFATGPGPASVALGDF